MKQSFLNNLLKEYEYCRQKNQDIILTRKQEIYNLCPKIREIDENLGRVSIESAKHILMKNDSKVLDELKDKINNLQEEKNTLLTTLNKPVDYLSPIYTCNICKDTGYINSPSRYNYVQLFKAKIV